MLSSDMIEERLKGLADSLNTSAEKTGSIPEIPEEEELQPDKPNFTKLMAEEFGIKLKPWLMAHGK